MTALLACHEPVAPERPPYLAILSRFTDTPEAVLRAGVHYTVEELSGTLGIRRTMSSQPGDTLILALPPASYVVELHDLPSACTVRDGPAKLITLLDSDNTGVLRFNVTCVPSLTVEVLADGYDVDPEVVYRVTGAGIERSGVVHLDGPDTLNIRGDTTYLEALAGGDYRVALSHLAPNCVLYGNSAATEQTISLEPGGGGTVTFRIRCSEAVNRPRLLALASTYHDGTSGFVFRVADPDRDVSSYRWDLTDCRGASVLPEGAPRIRKGLDAGRTLRADTLTIVGAFEVGLPDADLAGRCTAIMIEDFRGNTSTLFEQRIAASRFGSAPQSNGFNARLVGTTSISAAVSATDPDGDFAGTFVAVRARDGVLAPFDGQPDIGILSPVGYLDTNIPSIPLGGKLRWDDVYAVIVYLIDEAGNFQRLIDLDMFR